MALKILSSSCARSRSVISCSSSVVRVLTSSYALLQRGIALLNLGQHDVEAIDQRTDLIVVRLLCAKGKVLLSGDGSHRAFEIQNRLEMTVCSRDERRNATTGRAQHQDRDDTRVAVQAGVPLPHVGTDVQGAEPLAL